VSPCTKCQNYAGGNVPVPEREHFDLLETRSASRFPYGKKLQFFLTIATAARTGSNLRSHTGASRTVIRAPCFDEEFDCGYRSVSSGSAASLGAVRRNFMSPSPVALPARFLKKSAAVSTTPTFSATAAAIHWFNDTPSSFASRWAAFLMERGSLNGLVALLLVSPSLTARPDADLRPQY
jgi:hypothetical protein